jgi:uncharacterized protein (DUF58 family)
VERVLTKTRALLALVLVLTVAAFNRQDAILYAMAFALACVAVLGWGIPWLALRSATLRPQSEWREEAQAVEGSALALPLRLRQAGWWPAWLVEVEAEWSWAGRAFLTRDTVAFLPPRSAVDVLRSMRFGCRGHYRLTALRLRSGFPLGLVEAVVESPVPELLVRVLPAPASVQLPATWTVSEDSTGDQAVGHAGESLELNMLRAYEPGEEVRRVDWRASARAGELVVRQFQHPASVLVKLMVELPGPDEVGQPDAPGEHAVRAAAGTCAFLARAGVRTLLLLPGLRPIEADDAMSPALAGALRGSQAWAAELRQQARVLRRGEQIVAIVAATAEATALREAAAQAAYAGARLHVVIAAWRGVAGDMARRASELRDALKQDGIEAWLAWH